MYFETSNGISMNKKQDFMWVADYFDGTDLLEFQQNGKENSFYSINKNNLYKFGLVGCGYKMYFDTTNGIFNISDRIIELEYIDENDKIYNLNSGKLYNDIIQFKEAESTFDPFNLNGIMKTSICQFNFGYKQKLQFEDINLNLKVICKVPYDKPVYLEITLSSNKTLNGKLLIKRNGKTIDIIDAPLQEGKKGTLNWNII